VENDDARERLEAEQGRVEGLIEELKSELGTSETEGSSELADYDQHPADTASDTFEREKEWNHLKWVPRLESEMRTAWADFLAGVDPLHKPESESSLATVSPSRASAC